MKILTANCQSYGQYTFPEPSKFLMLLKNQTKTHHTQKTTFTSPSPVSHLSKTRYI